MPLYEYQCDACGHRFEVIRKFSDPPIEVCPKCGGHVQKLIASPAFHLKGTGWYATDYAKKDAPGGKSSSGDSEKPSSSDAKETPAKTETTATPAADTPSSTASKVPPKD